MCGIAGYYSPSGRIREEDLPRMMNAMFHRGPDAGGTWSDEVLGFAHRRLSIIDLSRSADQPMISQNGRYVMVYNGEVYNFREIAEDLGLILRTSSDTEVVLEAFALLGEDFINLLNGMFVIAIYDIHQRILRLFRDRIGIKPLYLYQNGTDIAFASEIKALTACPGIKNNLVPDPEAINDFLHMGFIPEPRSCYTNIKKFPAASMAAIDATGVSIKEYWNLYEKISPSIYTDETTAKEQLTALLFDSVKHRMISDVPFGVFLSGGIDSSLVAAIAQKQSPVPLNTFTIGFEENHFDERLYARKVAKHLGTDHHEYLLKEREAIDLLDKSIELFDEPFGDSSAIPTMLVSQMARKSATMVLTGDGGDELFMGYGAHLWARRLSGRWVRYLHRPVSVALNLMDNRWKRISKLFNYDSDTDMRYHVFSQEQYCFSAKELKTVLNPEFYTGITGFGKERKTSRVLTPIEKQSFFDLQVYLKDDLLVKVDRTSMFYSLECRVPILDYRIVEFAVNLDTRLKTDGNSTKIILKKILYDLVPQSYFDRPKQGFSVPMKSWLRGELKEQVMDYLSHDSIMKYNILNFNSTETLLKDFYLNGKDYLFNRIWLLFVLQKMIPRL